MSQMIERVAKAIYEQRNGFGCMAWSRRDASHKAPYMADAKVAIAAMREPTAAMKEAWDRDFEDWLAERIEAEYHPYTVMIEEALK